MQRIAWQEYVQGINLRSLLVFLFHHHPPSLQLGVICRLKVEKQTEQIGFLEVPKFNESASLEAARQGYVRESCSGHLHSCKVTADSWQMKIIPFCSFFLKAMLAPLGLVLFKNLKLYPIIL